MLIVRIDPDKVATSLILQHRLLNHRVIRSLCFGWRPDWERTLLLPLTIRASSSNIIHFLLHNFGQECAFDYATLFEALTAHSWRIAIKLYARAKSDSGCASRRWRSLAGRHRLRLTRITIGNCLLHNLVLQADEIKKVCHEVAFDFEIKNGISVQGWR